MYECMYAIMTDHIAILKDRIEKAKAKVQRYQKSLETAKSELSDLETTLRVLEGIANDGDSNGAGTSSTMSRQLDIVRLLTVGREKGQPPADLYKSYCLIGGEDITIDTFRTTIWRMKDRVFETDGSEWVVHGDSGNYWKEPLEEPEPEAPEFETASRSWDAYSDEEPEWARDDNDPIF